MRLEGEGTLETVGLIYSRFGFSSFYTQNLSVVVLDLDLVLYWYDLLVTTVVRVSTGVCMSDDSTIDEQPPG